MTWDSAPRSRYRRRPRTLAEWDGHKQHPRSAVGRGVYAFLLNPQGHILGDIYAYNRGESITVDTDWGQLEKILATFDHYIIMDDVEVANLSEQLTALGIAGPKTRAGAGGSWVRGSRDAIPRGEIRDVARHRVRSRARRGRGAYLV
jgi:folate-binding Fe-S cluster repair protein YgfZ